MEMKDSNEPIHRQDKEWEIFLYDPHEKKKMTLKQVRSEIEGVQSNQCRSNVLAHSALAFPSSVPKTQRLVIGVFRKGLRMVDVRRGIMWLGVTIVAADEALVLDGCEGRRWRIKTIVLNVGGIAMVQNVVRLRVHMSVAHTRVVCHHVVAMMVRMPLVVKHGVSGRRGSRGVR